MIFFRVGLEKVITLPPPKILDIDDDHTKTQGNVTNNSLFVGSTAELQKMLKKGFLNNKESDTDK